MPHSSWCIVYSYLFLVTPLVWS